MNPEYSEGLVCISIAIFAVMWLAAYGNRNSLAAKVSLRDKMVMIVLTAFTMFSFYDTDYYHYITGFESLRGPHPSEHFEEGYHFIAQYVSNYLTFRFIVWGSAVLLFQSAVRRLKLNLHQALFILVSVFALKFSYGRVSLAMAMMYWGFSRLIYPGKDPVMPRILGLLMLCLSFYFHKSAPFGIAIILISLFPIRRNMFLLSLVLFPIVALAVQASLAHVMSMNADDASALSVETAQFYMERKSGPHGPGALIQKTLERIPYYIIVVIYAKCLLSNKIRRWRYSTRAIANASYLTIYISSIFLLDLSVETSIMYYRFLYFAMIPSAMFLTYCYTNNIYRKWVVAAIRIGLMAECYNLLYSLHIAPA